MLHPRDRDSSESLFAPEIAHRIVLADQIVLAASSGQSATHLCRFPPHELAVVGDHFPVSCVGHVAKRCAAPCAFDITGCAAKRPETQAESDVQVSLRNLKSANDTEQKKTLPGGVCRNGDGNSASVCRKSRCRRRPGDRGFDPFLDLG